MIPELVAVWGAIVGYVVASVLFVVGAFLGKPRMLSAAVVASWMGLASQALAIGLRWVRVGHGPYLGFYEVASLLAFLSVLGFLLLQRAYPGLRVGGVVALPLAFLILGATLLVNNEARAVTGSLASFWLAIHVVFANLAYGFYVAAFVLAVAYLMRDSKHSDRYGDVLAKFPEQAELDGLMYRIVGAGFVFQGIMIASGAIWANEAWGSYWSWDPIETWSLLAWAVYAIYLHLTLTMGWRGRKAAWVVVIALPVILFSLLGVPIFYDSVHGAYLSV